ncbi:MAG: citrate/2-methylcitrate synthase [Thaumarchaeota archaeon]|nr:citrate/2-methylcitrate synthase [Nitrososphaerota archaeon]MBI3116970.1 citrate/2-methylcitrate synthase [Nitrososphaerota archaeon]
MSKGLEDVVAATSSITYIDGIKGRLLYRGYDIADLVENSSYEETAYLIWNARLPTERELSDFTKGLVSKRPIPSGVDSVLNSLPTNCDAMDALKIAVAVLGIFDDPMYSTQEKAASIASKMGTMSATIHRHKHNTQPLKPKDGLNFSSNLLYMITGKEPDELMAKVMDVVLILHADHELNASTFAARVVASTLSDIYSSITAAVGALKGPLHGGANEKVVDMTEEIGSPDRAERYVLDKLSRKEKIMGFGHRVYKTDDPRAKILKDYARKLISSEKHRKDFEILTKLQEVMIKEKQLHANVDLFSGFVLNHIGVPTYLFTPIFAVGRSVGWLAHIMEQYSNNRIMRPVAEYSGPQQELYVPVERRSAGVR